MSSRLRLFATAAILLALGGLAFLIFRGDDSPPAAPPANVNAAGASFGKGHAQGERSNAHSWTVDYDKIDANADQSVLKIEGVHNGVIYRNGKPYLRVKAERMTVNTLTRDFIANGPMHVELVQPKRWKAIDTVYGEWNNTRRKLLLPKSAVIVLENGEKVHVDKASIDLNTGHIRVEQIEGRM